MRDMDTDHVKEPDGPGPQALRRHRRPRNGDTDHAGILPGHDRAHLAS